MFTQSELLLSRYEALLGRKRPQITEFRDLLRSLKRYSMIELGEDTEDGLPIIRIFPTIRLVTGSKVQERIQSFVLKNEEDAESDDNGHFDEEDS